MALELSEVHTRSERLVELFLPERFEEDVEGALAGLGGGEAAGFGVGGVNGKQRLPEGEDLGLVAAQGEVSERQVPLEQLLEALLDGVRAVQGGLAFGGGGAEHHLAVQHYFADRTAGGGRGAGLHLEL